MREFIARHTEANNTDVTRSAKRAILAALLLSSGGTAAAQAPSGTLIQAPSARSQPNATVTQPIGIVRGNPFVTDTQSQPGASAHSGVRLKADDASIGFQPIASGNQPHAARLADHPITITPSPAPAIRHNPFIAPTPSESDAIAQETSKLRPSSAPTLATPSRPARLLPAATPELGSNVFSLSDSGGDMPTADDPASPEPIAAPQAGTTENSTPETRNAFAKHYGGRNADSSPKAVSPERIAVPGPAAVMPVTDARDAQTPIRETQPIFFSMTDGTANAQKGATETDASHAEDASRPSDAPEASSAPEASTHTAPVVSSAEQAKVLPRAKRSPVHLAPPTIPVSAAPAFSLSGSDDPSKKHTLAQLDTPVQLAPIVDFSKPLQNSLTDGGPSSPSESTANAPQVASDATAEGQSRTDEPPAEKGRVAAMTPQPAGEPPRITRPRRQAIAVVTPPIAIENATEKGQTYRPAVAAVLQDPLTNPGSMTGPTPPEGMDVLLPELDPAESIAADETVPPKSPEQDLSHLEAAIAEAAPQTQRPEVRPELPAPVLPAPIPRPDVPHLAAEAQPSRETPLRDPVPTPASSQVAGESNLGSGSPASPTLDVRPKHFAREPVHGHSAVPAKLASSRSMATGAVQPPQPPTSDAPKKPVRLQLARAQVRSMTIGGRLRRVSIANKDVCQAFASGPNQLKLIGTGTGSTELTVWADVIPGEPTRMQIFQVEVGDDMSSHTDRIADQTALLNDSIDKAFPQASVIVTRTENNLVVSGVCADEETAMQILRLVRKSCLVPVVDELETR
ncbi:hypothetical protein FYK55_13230 [Roseiconus nitratireducens]|uniref:Pilus formation protein N-terminal domain-containing protein n=1 Tax=Roseiconus nitratireducens TaxID=2605748 RepID=A0A5M6D777_9BACT|nr:pilus assembly protein N-terminal domain-containing protein [Roseiconus nitratireducens]KAA5543233.1 hypothetical protein FYK55_13230 [Roseiconus nitratireducens]